MALHVQFNIPYNVYLNQSNYAYGNPDNINDSFPVLNEREFINKVSFHIPDIMYDLFNKKQYWVRYLICIGDITKVFTEIDRMADNYYQNINVSDFINHVHPHFNGNTLIHHMVQWCPNVSLLSTLLLNGGTLTKENNDGYYPEEDIHRTVWFNPFARILNMNLEFSYLNNNDTRIWFVRNEADFKDVIEFIGNHIDDEVDDSDNDDSDNDECVDYEVGEVGEVENNNDEPCSDNGYETDEEDEYENEHEATEDEDENLGALPGPFDTPPNDRMW